MFDIHIFVDYNNLHLQTVPHKSTKTRLSPWQAARQYNMIYTAQRKIMLSIPWCTNILLWLSQVTNNDLLCNYTWFSKYLLYDWILDKTRLSPWQAARQYNMIYTAQRKIMLGIPWCTNILLRLSQVTNNDLLCNYTWFSKYLLYDWILEFRNRRRNIKFLQLYMKFVYVKFLCHILCISRFCVRHVFNKKNTNDDKTSENNINQGRHYHTHIPHKWLFGMKKCSK